MRVDCFCDHAVLCRAVLCCAMPCGAMAYLNHANRVSIGSCRIVLISRMPDGSPTSTLTMSAMDFAKVGK